MELFMNYYLFQVDIESSKGGIENYAKIRFYRTELPSIPRRRRQWAAARVPDQVVPCWASPVHPPRSQPTSTVTRHPACCPSFISVTVEMPLICSCYAPLELPGCWTSPRNCPATTRNGVSHTGRYPPRTLVIRIWNNTLRRRSILSVSIAIYC